MIDQRPIAAGSDARTVQAQTGKICDRLLAVLGGRCAEEKILSELRELEAAVKGLPGAPLQRLAIVLGEEIKRFTGKTFAHQDLGLYATKILVGSIDFAAGEFLSIVEDRGVTVRGIMNLEYCPPEAKTPGSFFYAFSDRNRPGHGYLCSLASAASALLR